MLYVDSNVLSGGRPNQCIPSHNYRYAFYTTVYWIILLHEYNVQLFGHSLGSTVVYGYILLYEVYFQQTYDDIACV